MTYEALVYDLPVVATPNMGLVVRDSEDGFNIPARSAEGIAEQIENFTLENYKGCLVKIIQSLGY
jgi:hypothetical protein